MESPVDAYSPFLFNSDIKGIPGKHINEKLINIGHVLTITRQDIAKHLVDKEHFIQYTNLQITFYRKSVS